MWIYVGTYTKGTSRGIYGLSLDRATGALGQPTLMAETLNPSFFNLTTVGDRLYAACDPGAFDGRHYGGVAAFAVNRDKTLTPVNQVPTEGGNCFVDVSPDGRFVTAVDYGGATVDLVAVRGDGGLEKAVRVAKHSGRGPNQHRQDSAHAHCGKFAPGGRFVIVCDLGTDEVYVYRVDAPAATLRQHGVSKTAPGAGPRHVAFAKDSRVLYSVNELSNTVDVWKWDGGAGTLTLEQTVPTLPADFKGESTASEVVVHPSGAFVYAANRGHDSIAVFHVEPGTGHLSPAGHTPTGGKQPRHFNVEPNGKFLIAANEKSHNVVVLKIDHDTGTLTPTGHEAAIDSPVCVRFLS